MRDLTPEAKPAPVVETPLPKPEPKPAELKPPALAAPKEIETPAEPRAAAKPEAKPVLPPAKVPDASVPDKPALLPPKSAEPAPDALPALKPPTKPDEAKPAAPKKPQDDPFGANHGAKSLRLWTDASGKYHIEARFVSYANGSVHLQKADGRYYHIKFDRLSADDRDFVLHQDGSLFAAE
jgi:hypothetical protein